MGERFKKYINWGSRLLKNRNQVIISSAPWSDISGIEEKRKGYDYQVQ
jgi:hypothetical protein